MILPPFTRVLARRPAQNMADGLTTQTQLGKPDVAKALAQYDEYVGAFHDLGLQVTVLPPDERFPDGHFIEDPVVVFRDMAFICRSGAKPRAAEGEAVAKYLSNLNQVTIQGDEGLVDGGDILFCSDRVLIGLSNRTNREGAEQLASALRQVQANLRVDIVRFESVLHLKTGINELAPGVLVLSPEIQTDYDLSFAETVILPSSEAYAANLVPVNGTLLIAAGFPEALEIAQRYYANDRIVQLEMSEFQKMDGGLSCLSLRY